MPSHPAFLSSRWIACFMAFCLFQPLLAAAETRVIEARRYDDALSGLAVSFLARDLATGTDYVLEGSTLDRRYTPLSTFKIANLVIALETGVAASLDDWRPWIPQERPAEPHWPEAWRQGQTLEQASVARPSGTSAISPARSGATPIAPSCRRGAMATPWRRRMTISGSTIRCASRSASRWASWRSSLRDDSMSVPGISLPWTAPACRVRKERSPFMARLERVRMIRRMPTARFQDGTSDTCGGRAVSRWCLPCTSRDLHFAPSPDFAGPSP